MTRRSLSLTLATAAALLQPTQASAAPQANVGMRLGVAETGDKSGWTDTRLHLGAHGDVLLARKRNTDFGIGPYAQLHTNWGDFQAGGGASLLLPIHPYLPIVLSAGGYTRKQPGVSWEPGAAVELFWGSRSYNFSSSYVMAGGLVLQAHQGLGTSHEKSLVVAVHLDGEVLALPFVLLYEAIRGARTK